MAKKPAERIPFSLHEKDAALRVIAWYSESIEASVARIESLQDVKARRAMRAQLSHFEARLAGLNHLQQILRQSIKAEEKRREVG